MLRIIRYEVTPKNHVRECLIFTYLANIRVGVGKVSVGCRACAQGWPGARLLDSRRVRFLLPVVRRCWWLSGVQISLDIYNSFTNEQWVYACDLIFCVRLPDTCLWIFEFKLVRAFYYFYSSSFYGVAVVFYYYVD